MKRALIAMSGGVDSSVAAYIMRERGYDCIGATMRLFEFGNDCVARDTVCCSLNDVHDARNVCNLIGIPYHVYNFQADFRKEVIDRFIRTYENGGTPNPCIDCNRYLKFESLYDKGRELGCEYIAAGHYARIEQNEDGRWSLKKAVDLSKDQSYVLYSLTQQQLAHTVFPLGSMKKTQTRRVAEEQGFVNARKHDSQDICFVPDGDYAAAIRRFTGKDYPHGDFVDQEGNVLGEHQGIIRYTIGQRKGLGLALKKPMYVLRKDVEHNQVVLADNSDLFSRELNGTDFNWIAWDRPPAEFRCSARIRYNQKEQPATVTVTGDPGSIRLCFDEPQRAITPGQAVVLYDGDSVLGGGTIQ